MIGPMISLKLKRTILCFVISIFLVTPVRATEMTQAFLDGIRYYKVEKYDSAISSFSKIVDSGIKNSKLFYNLANGYLKNDNLGYAILWYERALKLTPNDPDLKFNHKYALSLVKDENEAKDVSIFRVLFFWKQLLGSMAVLWAGIILNVLFWTILVLQIVNRKKIFKMPGYVLLVLTIIFTSTALYNYYEAAYIKKAIILPSKVPVRSGFSEDSTELFVLHSGTKVTIEKENRDYFRIFFSDGKIGWIKKSEAGVI